MTSEKDQKQLFYAKISDSKYSNLERGKFLEIIHRLLEFKNDPKTKKEKGDYRLLERYSVMEVNVAGHIEHRLVKNPVNRKSLQGQENQNPLIYVVYEASYFWLNFIFLFNSFIFKGSV